MLLTGFQKKLRHHIPVAANSRTLAYTHTYTHCQIVVCRSVHVCYGLWLCVQRLGLEAASARAHLMWEQIEISLRTQSNLFKLFDLYRCACRKCILKNLLRICFLRALPALTTSISSDIPMYKSIATHEACVSEYI